NTTPNQLIVAKNGSYSFDVRPGKYAIIARHPKEGLIANETIVVSLDGVYIIDLILMPSFELEEELAGSNFTIALTPFEEQTSRWPLYLLIAIAFFVGAYLLLRKSLRKSKKSTAETIAEAAVKAVPATKEKDLPEQILEFVRKEGGRTTQKEIRKAIPFSEAKISLAITELENKGQITKIKKGRANVIVLKNK
ncbi:MAG: hypothetical protein QXU88_01060, partial [Candidatus Woesearchaeota archaeon]